MQNEIKAGQTWKYNLNTDYDSIIVMPAVPVLWVILSVTDKDVCLKPLTSQSQSSSIIAYGTQLFTINAFLKSKRWSCVSDEMYDELERILMK